MGSRTRRRVATFNGRFGLAYVEHDGLTGRYLVVDGWSDPCQVVGFRATREEAELEARRFAGVPRRGFDREA